MAIPGDIRTIQAKHKKSILKKENVVGVGYGYKYASGKKTDEACLVVLVEKKKPVSQLKKKDIVPPTIEDVTVDVKEVGKILIHKSRTDRWRPAPGGVSIGHYLITAGTLGAIVKDANTGEKLILSNNHVLANSNDAAKGDSIIQPGAADGGKNPQDLIATLERFVRIEMSGGDGDNGSCMFAKSSAAILNLFAKIVGSSHRVYATKIAQQPNYVDAAVAKPIDDSAVDDEIIDIGKVTETKAAELGMSVRKSGRTTSTTTGTIEMLNATVNVGYGVGKEALFEDQILTSNMSQPGDSGSLLVDGEQNKAVGLLFAGSDEVTVHSPIEKVMELLEIKFE